MVSCLTGKTDTSFLIKSFLKLYSENNRFQVSTRDVVSSKSFTRKPFVFSNLTKAEPFKNDGYDEFGNKDFRNAIFLYTKGIKVDCKDQELKAKLYNNRATAHFNLGDKKSFEVFIILSS